MNDEAEMLIPFVVATSKGGPFEDNSFVAGYQCGAIEAQLSAQTESVFTIQIVRRDILAQVDLIAMHHGWITEYETTDEEGFWCAVTFKRARSL